MLVRMEKIVGLLWAKVAGPRFLACEYIEVLEVSDSLSTSLVYQVSAERVVERGVTARRTLA